MAIIINGTSGITNDATDLSYTGTLTGGTGVVNLGSGQLVKDASGNVGIGTSSPTNKLHVQGSVTLANYANIGAAGNDAGISLTGGSVTNNGGQINLRGGSFGTANAIEFIQGGTERARIDSGGSLLVGSTSNFQGSKLSVSAVWPQNVLGVNVSSSNSTAAVAFFGFNGAAVGNIICSNSTTAFNTSSDYRLKEAIAPMQGALSRVAALKPVTYKWKVDGSDGEGFIAHELQAVVPDCVTGEKDAVDAEGKPQYQGIDTSFLVATLTAAIQEQQAIIQSLTTRITALEAK